MIDTEVVPETISEESGAVLIVCRYSLGEQSEAPGTRSSRL